MFNTKFATIEECKKLNNLDEKALCAHLQRYFENQNYRSTYNKAKNALMQTPQAKEFLAKLRKTK